MKRKIKICFPAIISYTDEIEVNVPEGNDPGTWLNENWYDLISNHPMCDDGFSNDPNAWEYGYTKAEFVDNAPTGERED